MPANDATPLIPREILFGNPVKTQARISPDGQFLSFIAPVDGVLNVWVGDIYADLEKFTAITRDSVRGIRVHFWSPDSTSIFYLQDAGGDENWRLYTVDIATKNTRDLTPFENVLVQIIDINKRFPNQILLAMNKDDARYHDVYKLDLISGDLTKILANPGNHVSWGVDPEQKIRTATVALPDGGSQLLVRDPNVDESEWTDLVLWGQDDTMTSDLLGFNADSSSVYLIDSRNVNAGRLVKLSLRDKTTEVVLEDSIYDVGPVIQHPDTYDIQAVAITRDKTEWTFFDQALKVDFEQIAKTVAGELSLAARDDVDNTWLVAATDDRRSASYYVYNRSTKNVRFLFSTRPELDKFLLAPMEPIEFQSRDGMTIHGYLSIPLSVPRQNLPLVLDVHGGPWARDGWGLNSEVQWLVNRGYAVLQVNFRGSTGYGKKFVNAGDKEWGGKMHDDLVDAVNWAVSHGIADKEKIAIYGGSYGGYAALVGATFTPTLFRCAVDIVGPSNLITFINSIPPYWAPFIAQLHNRVGNPETEEDFLKSRSPLLKVDQIHIPLLIAQGANDPRVKRAESEQIVEALKAKNLDYEYLLFPDEGHGFARPENRIKFYAAAETFLAKHLGGRHEAQPAKVTEKS